MLNKPPSLAARLHLGRLLYRLWHQPIGAIRRSVREGGPLEQWRNMRGHAAMKAAAAVLPALQSRPVGPDADICFVTGTHYWHQTLFCFASLQEKLPFRVTPVLFDDGSMNDTIRRHMSRVVPWICFVSAEETEARLDELLPVSRYPALRGLRRTYPHLRKLLDIHVGAAGYRLVADSDMLFFREPKELADWFAQPFPFYIQDVATAYGYPLDFLDELAGAPVPPMVNVGLYALDSSRIDWDRVEYWCRMQLETFGTEYVQEQALTAMLFAAVPGQALDRHDYVVMPDEAEGRAPRAVLHHYVDLSKRTYFRHGWRQALNDANRD